VVEKNYSEHALESIALNVIKQYNPSLLYGTPRAIPIEDIIEKQYGLKIEYQHIRKNGELLGETIFGDMWVPIYDKESEEYTMISVKKGTIIIDAGLLNGVNDGRLRFTCAHELAHWLIHKDVYSGSEKLANMLNLAGVKHSEYSIMEKQADSLGSSLLMPAGRVKAAYYSLSGTMAHKGKTETIEMLSEQFDVSKQAMEIRLKTCKLI